MIATFSVLAASRQLATAIAASGVSLHDADEHLDLSKPCSTTTGPGRGPRPSQATNPYLSSPPYCPECGTILFRASACITCPGCGWGKCG